MRDLVQLTLLGDVAKKPTWQDNDAKLLAELEQPGPLYWRMSAKWASKEIDCTLHGIQNYCHGACETTNSLAWPPANAATGLCHHLGPNGCALGDERPISCHLCPFEINSTGTIVLMGRALCTMCKPAYKKGGKSIAENMYRTWQVIFGLEQADLIISNTKAGKDTVLLVPEETRKELAAEIRMVQAGTVPAARQPRPYALSDSNWNGSTACPYHK